VKLVDFGIAKTATSGETKAGVFKGKIQYVSPEQYTGGPLDRRADIYSAGVVLWEAATRRRMWKDVGDLTVMHRVGTGDIPRPSSVDTDVPARLEAMCMKALAPRKEDRYPTAAAFQADIEDFLQELGSRVSAREVGALTAKTFADDRASVKVLIDDQLRLVREYPDPQSLVPTVTLQQDTASRPTKPESSLFPAFTTQRNRRRNVAIALAGGFALLVAVLVLLSSSSSDQHGPLVSVSPVPAGSPPVLAEPAPLPEPATPTPTQEPPGPPQVMLKVATEPENAHVLVDGVLLSSNGETVKFPKDGAMHKVRAEAPGYRPRTEWVRFDSEELSLQINLDAGPSRKGRKESKEGKEAKEAPPSSVLVEPSLPPTATSAPSPGGAPFHEIESQAARRRSSAPPLDTADPWKK
jgi:serine/threonine-protein kinase